MATSFILQSIDQLFRCVGFCECACRNRYASQGTTALSTFDLTGSKLMDPFRFQLVGTGYGANLGCEYEE